MLPRVVTVKAIQRYVVELTFTDGIRATVNLDKWIAGHAGVFVRLHDDDFFRQVAVDPEAGTIVWPNGVDFCPDALYAEATARKIDPLACPENTA